MVNIHRVRVAFTGLAGLPGVSTFYANAGQDMIGPLRAFYSSLGAAFPSGIVAQVENFGDIIEDSTGVLTGTWAGAAVAPTGGGDAGGFSSPTGACVNWLTGTVVGGRRLRGRTFIVPLGGSSYQNNGTLTPAFLDALTLACANLQVATAATFKVWGRPRLARAATPTSPAVSARAGTSALVTASAFKDKCAVLRSRRD